MTGITVNEKTYPLRYTVNSVCAMEALCPDLEAVFDKPLTAARLLLWGGLIADSPAFSPEAAGELLDDYRRAGGSIAEAERACLAALEDAGFLPREEK